MTQTASPITRWLATGLSRLYFGDTTRAKAITDYLSRMSPPGVVREGLAQLAFRWGTEYAPAPRAVRFEVTNHCNLACKMCPQPSTMVRPKRHLDLDTYVRVLDSNPHIEEVDLFNWGEPLVNPRLGDFIRIATERGLYSRLVTNAVLLSDRRVRMLVDNGLDAVIFSVDNVGERYEYVRGTKFDATMANIERLLAYAREVGSPLYSEIALTKSEANRDGIDAAVSALRAMGMGRVVVEDSQDFDTSRQRPTRCMEPYRYAVVLSNGEVVPCCVDYDGTLSMGNVTDDANLESVYNSEQARELRRRNRTPETLPPTCRRCTYRLLDH